MRLLVKNINTLAGIEHAPKLRLQGKEMAAFNTIDDAWLRIEDGRFAAFGSVADGMPTDNIDETIDAEAEWFCRRGATRIRTSSSQAAESASSSTR